MFKTPVFCYLLAFERVINGEAEDERKTGGNAAFQLVQVTGIEPLIPHRLALRCVGVAFWHGLVSEFIDVIRPLGFLADSEGRDGLHAIANLRPSVGIDGPLHISLVVVDEEPGGPEYGDSLFLLLELNSSGYGVGGATTELALIINRWTTGPKILLRRQFGEYRLRSRVEVVTLVGQVGSPTVLAIDRHVSSPPGTVIIGIPILAPGLGQVYTHPHPVEPQCCSFSLWEPPSSPEGCSCCLREKSRTGTSCLSSHSSDTSPTITPGRLIWLCHCLDLPPRHRESEAPTGAANLVPPIRIDTWSLTSKCFPQAGQMSASGKLGRWFRLVNQLSRHSPPWTHTIPH